MDSFVCEPIIAQHAALLPRGDSVLCVGCGDGTELAHFPGSVGVALGYDAPAMFRFPRIAIADMHCLPFRDRSFDGIYCKDTFEHALAPTIVFSEFARVARRWVFLCLPDETWAGSPLHPLILTKDQLAWITHKAGWKFIHDRQRVSQRVDEGKTYAWYLDSYYCTRRKT